MSIIQQRRTAHRFQLRRLSALLPTLSALAFACINIDASPRAHAATQSSTQSSAQPAPQPTKPEDLPRRGTIGLGLQPTSAGTMSVAVLRPNGPAERAGLKLGDILHSIDNTPITSQEQLGTFLRTKAGGSAVKAKLLRDNTPLELPITLDTTATEQLEGGSSIYSSVAVPAGHRLRTIITEPNDTNRAKLAGANGSPAFMYVQGIYCGSVDRPQIPQAPDTRMMHELTRAGYVTLRVDKQGLGDSQGPPCAELDFATELAGYVAALEQLRTWPGVDPQRIYVFGHSMGGVMMPYLVEQHPVRGAIVYGTLARTWFEYTIENVRRQMKLNGASDAEISDQIQNELRSNAMILIDKKSMGDVWKRWPEMRAESPMVSETQLASRGMSFYHQLQDLNLARAWGNVTTRVLAIYGEYDWVTSYEDHELIAALVNAKTPGNAEALSLPKFDHGLTSHDSLAASLQAMGQGTWDGSLTTTLTNWIDKVEGRAANTPPEAPTAEKAEKRSNAAPAAAPAAAANAQFPESWIGHWAGDATSGNGTTAQKFRMELIIAPTDSKDRFRWTIIYAGAQGRQERAYTLIVKDAAKGLYSIDENNGIILDSRYIDGTLFGHFIVQGNRISTRERLENPGTPDEFISTELVTTIDDQATTTGGAAGVPEVKTWAPVGVQKATLRRVDASKAQSTESKNAAAPAAATAASLPDWKILPTERYPGKQDDIFFINEKTGWYVNGAGKIFKTTDAGDTWTQKLHKPGTYFRCIAFIDEKIGLAGNIGPGYFPNVSDSTPLYRTTDGGETWQPVTSIEGPPIVGLCAIEVLHEQFVNAGNLDTRTRIYAAGRVGGPAALIFSDDLGLTWKQIPIAQHAAMAFDVHFFDRQHGIIAAASSADVAESNALILTTTDGGSTWTKAYQSARPFELTWKISFPTRDVGYVTIQSYNPDPAASERFVAKTTDAGKTWTEIPLINDAKVRQFGVAFIDENRGWIGAMPQGFATTDGGATWTRTNFGNAVNKIRVLKTDTAWHAFAIGVQVSRTTVPIPPK